MNKITAHIAGDQISSNSKEAINLHASKRFGEKDKDKIVYTFCEALYLLEEDQLEILDLKDKKLKKKQLLKRLLKSDKKVLLKLIVYKNLRKHGLVPKTALKYGADFRIYRGKTGHSKWICFVDSEKSSLNWQEFSSKSRVAHSTKKSLLLAIVDGENDTTYYEVNWKKL
ncbi:tRNA-intron lyase [archaeon]|jgi:tRNA-intron endonuclease, archaea type|nr:tRNA-intron lyase [archaeon]